MVCVLTDHIRTYRVSVCEDTDRGLGLSKQTTEEINTHHMNRYKIIFNNIVCTIKKYPVVCVLTDHIRVFRVSVCGDTNRELGLESKTLNYV